MHYYQFNIADYRKDTVHLSRLEHGIYRDLIDWYYLDEKPIPKETQMVSRRLRLASEEEYKALENVLSDFFVESEDGFRHIRIDQDIEKYHTHCEKNKANGKNGGRPKGSGKAKKTQSVSAGLPDGSDSEPNRNPNQEPITNNQVIEPNGSVASKLPTCPHQAVIDLYHQHLPELPSVRILSESRKKSIGTFWKWVLTSKKSDGTPRATDKAGALEWISAYFDRARDNDFLMGRSGRSGDHSTWTCDLDFLLTERGKKHVIERTQTS